MFIHDDRFDVRKVNAAGQNSDEFAEFLRSQLHPSSSSSDSESQSSSDNSVADPLPGVPPGNPVPTVQPQGRPVYRIPSPDVRIDSQTKSRARGKKPAQMKIDDKPAKKQKFDQSSAPVHEVIDDASTSADLSPVKIPRKTYPARSYIADPFRTGHPKLDFSWEQTYHLYSPKIRLNEETIIAAVVEAVSNVPSTVINTAYRDDFTHILQAVGTNANVRVSENHILVTDEVYKQALSSLQSDQVRKMILASSYICKSRIHLDCTHDQRLDPDQPVPQAAITNCQISVFVSPDSSNTWLPQFSYTLNDASKQVVQNAFNTISDRPVISAFVQSNKSNKSFLDGKDLTGSVPGALVHVQGTLRHRDQFPELEEDADQLSYWIGSNWWGIDCILPLCHVAMILLVLVYCIYRHISDRKCKVIYESMHEDAMRFLRSKVNRGFSKVGSRDYGCGPDLLARVLPLRRSWFAVGLFALWFVLFIASIVILYVIEYGWASEISVKAESTFYVCAVLFCLSLELIFILCVRYFDISISLAITVDGIDATHVKFEELVPMKGTALESAIANAQASVADPQTQADEKAKDLQRKQRKLEQSASLLHSGSPPATSSTRPYTSDSGATKPHEDDLCFFNPPTQLITRAWPEQASIIPSTHHSFSIPADGDHSLLSSVRVAKTCVLPVTRRTVLARERKEDVEKEIVRFVYHDIPYVWSMDKHCFEQYDYTMEAIRLANMRLTSGLSNQMVQQRKPYTTADHNQSSDWMSYVLHPYVLVVFIACFAVVPRWNVFWVVSVLLLLMVIGVRAVQNAFYVNVVEDNRHVEVLRDGKWIWLNGDELVTGDIIRLVDDSVVPADCVLVWNGVIVQEEGLTGNLMPVQKYPISDRRTSKERGLYPYNCIYAGSKVLFTSNKSLAVVTDTHGRSQKQRMLHYHASKGKKQIEFGLLLCVAIIVLVYISMWYVCAFYFNGRTFDGLGVSVWVRYFVTNWVYQIQDLFFNQLPWCSFHLGVLLLPWYLCREWFRWRLNEDVQVRCHSMQSLESATNMSVCIFDKTSTITTSSMKISLVYPADANQFQDAIPCDGHLPKDIQMGLACCNRVTLGPDGTVHGNDIDLVMFNASGWTISSQEHKGTKRILPPDCINGTVVEVLHTVCYDFNDGLSGVLVQHAEEITLFIRGSLESVLPLVSDFDGSIDSNKFGMAIACRAIHPDALVKLKKVPREQLLVDLEMLAFISFENPIRADSGDVISALHENGVSTIMATGDHVETSLEVARCVGILDDSAPTIIGHVHLLPDVNAADSSLDAIIPHDVSQVSQPEQKLIPHTVVWRNISGEIVPESDIISASPGSLNVVLTGPAFCRLNQRQVNGEESYLFKTILPNLRVCTRISPDDKARLVELLKDAGHCVAVCGRGVSNAPALNTADVGIGLSDKVSRSFTSNRESISVVLDVMRYGQSYKSSLYGVFFFAVMQVLISTYGRIIMEGVRGVFYSPIILRTDLVRCVIVLILIAAIPFFPIGKSAINLKLKLMLVVYHMLIGFGSLFVLRFAIIKGSINEKAWDWVNTFGLKDLLDVRLQTSEASMACLFIIWFLATFGLCLLLLNTKLLHRCAFLYLALLAKILVFMLLWGGPSMFHCWFGVNCDGYHSWKYTNSCLYGVQLLNLNQEYEKNFVMPRSTAESRCRSSHQDVLLPRDEIHVAFPGFGKSVCEWPHNCIGTSERWQASIVFAAATFLCFVGTMLAKNLRSP